MCIRDSHSAGPLGLADLVATLYFRVMNVDPKNPEDPERDVFFLSNGHCVPVQYATTVSYTHLDVYKRQVMAADGTIPICCAHQAAG